MKFLAFGEVMMRLTVEPYKKLSQSNKLDMNFTGTGVNVLSGLYQFGHQCSLITVLPNHNVGWAAAGVIRQLGIRDDMITYHGQHIGVYFLEMGIASRPSEITYLNRSESAFNQTDYDLDKLQEQMQGYEAIHFCGISLSQNEKIARTVLNLAKMSKEQGLKVIFDCNYRPTQWAGKDQTETKRLYQKMMNLADIAFVSVKDAAHLDIETENKEEREILQEILERYQLEALFGTRRPQGSYQGYMLSQTDYVESKVYPLEVYDRIGAGDAFAAGVLHGYYQGWGCAKIIDFGTASGVLAHATFGDSPLLKEADVMDYCLNGNRDIRR